MIAIPAETPAISDAMDLLSLPGGVVDGLVAIAQGSGVALGPARTATVIDSHDPNIPGLAEYLDGAQDGDMLVLGWEAAGPRSVWGGLAATRTQASGCVGLVTQGWVRDLVEVRDTSLLVWATGSTPRSGKGRLAVDRVGEPTMVGEILVRDRDLVVSDATGVCVVPQEHQRAVLDKAAELQRRDDVFRQSLETGASFEVARDQAGTM